jgi:GT2 family glycosyltransferase
MSTPHKEYREQETVDLQGQWGDFSAWVAPLKVLNQVGSLDVAFDPTGMIADNDYLLRIRNAGYGTWRSYMMPFLHAKGVTQRPLRPGFPKDEIGIKARLYFKRKWGVDPYAGKPALFDRPFGGELD